MNNQTGARWPLALLALLAFNQQILPAAQSSAGAEASAYFQKIKEPLERVLSDFKQGPLHGINREWHDPRTPGAAQSVFNNYTERRFDLANNRASAALIAPYGAADNVNALYERTIIELNKLYDDYLKQVPEGLNIPPSSAELEGSRGIHERDLALANRVYMNAQGQLILQEPYLSKMRQGNPGYAIEMPIPTAQDPQAGYRAWLDTADAQDLREMGFSEEDLREQYLQQAQARQPRPAQQAAPAQQKPGLPSYHAWKAQWAAENPDLAGIFPEESINEMYQQYLQEHQPAGVDEDEKKEAAAVIPAGAPFPAEGFFKDVVGVSEDAFRNESGWNGTALTGINKQSFIDGYARRAAIFQGDGKLRTLGDLKKQNGQHVRPLGKPHFEIILDSDPRGKSIQEAQADPANKDAVFMVASTFFGPLEGGMIKPHEKLEEMLKRPVQGEWASISAAGATIYRKYFMKPVYLLQNFAKAPLANTPQMEYIDKTALEQYGYAPADEDQVGVFVHSDVFATTNYHRGPGGAHMLSSIPLQNNQTITQVFCSAYDFGLQYNKDKTVRHLYGASNKNAQSFARMILNTMYEAVARAAYAQGKKKIYFTLLGGGAFRNEIKWIGDALARPRTVQFIKDAGLEVYVLYRPDKDRYKPIRSAQTDIAFLERMVDVENDINGTQNTFKSRFGTYDQTLRAHYAHHPNQAPAVAAGPVAQQGAQLGGGLGFENVPYDPAKPYKIAWVYVPAYNDRVLVNYNKADNQPYLRADGSRNFVYVSPSNPGTKVVPEGIYYWESSAQVNIPAQLGKPAKINLTNRPAQPGQQSPRAFKYDKAAAGYVDYKGTKWGVIPFTGKTVSDLLLGR